jgi:hypothetical protein
MKTIQKCLLMLGGMSLSLMLAKPASAQSNDKPGVHSKEIRKVHIKIDDDKEGHVRKIDTTFEVGPDFDMKAWMKSMKIDVPEEEDGEVVLIAPPEPPQPPQPPQPCKPGSVSEFRITSIQTDESKTVTREYKNDGLTPPCDPKDKDCMIKWLESDSVQIMLKSPEPMELNGKDVMIFRNSDEKGSSTKMVFSRIIVKKIDTKTEGKESKSLTANVYPNPSNGVFNIEISVPGKTAAALEITDKDGKVIYTEEVSSSGKREVDLTSQGKGTFFLNLKQGKKTIQRQIMVN